MAVSFSTKQPITCQWAKPPFGWCKCNSDGSLNADCGGYGAILRNETGEVIAGCAGSATRQSVISHELQGVEAGLKLAQRYNIQKLVVTTDSTTVLGYLSKNSRVAWNIRHIIHKIRSMLNDLEDYKIEHAYRETNRAADRLAGLLPNSEFMEIIPSSFAEDLKKIVYEDSIGKSYLRL